MSNEQAPKKVAYPDYRPRSYRELNIILGQADAGLEWLEVGLRHLRAEHEAGGDQRTDKLAEMYGVKVNAFNWQVIVQQWARLQLVSVCQYFEWFLDEFRREFPRSFRSKDSKKEGPIQYTLDILGVPAKEAGLLDIAILDYYRLVRNRFLHDVDAEEPKKLATRREAIRADIPDSQYQRLNAPNEIESMQFDDFILFTRALKNFSRKICAHAQLTTEEMLNFAKADDAFVRKLRAWQNSPRLDAILAGYLRQRFGFSPTTDATGATLRAHDLLAQLAELPLQEPIDEDQSVAEGGGRGSSPRRVANKKSRKKRGR